jgi:hypothetical protein
MYIGTIYSRERRRKRTNARPLSAFETTRASSQSTFRFAAPIETRPAIGRETDLIRDGIAATRFGAIRRRRVMSACSATLQSSPTYSKQVGRQGWRPAGRATPSRNWAERSPKDSTWQTSIAAN